MNKKILGVVLNTILFAGYGVFCWYYCYIQPGYAEMNVFLQVLKFLGIFIASLAATALLHQFGHVVSAVFLGFKVTYFEACFFKLWNDGERARFGLFFDPSLFFSGNVVISFNGAFDTGARFKQSRAKYSKFLLGGFIFNAGALVVTVIIYVLCLSFGAVFSPLFIVALAVMLSNWFMLYGAFTDEPSRRGDFIAYAASRDTENLLTALAAQSLAEKMDHSFLFGEAQKVIAFKIQNDLPWLDKDSLGALSAVVFYACAGQGRLDAGIEDFFNRKFLTAEGAAGLTAGQKLLFVMNIKNFIAYYIINYGRERASEILELAAAVSADISLINKETQSYFNRVREALKESLSPAELRALTEIRFFTSGSFEAGFKNYRDIRDAAEGKVRRAIYGWQEGAG